MYSSLKRLYLELSKKERKRLLLLALLITITALLQVVGIASIFPFIATASDPSVVGKNAYLYAAKTYFSIENDQDFIVLLGAVVLVTLVLTNMFLAFSSWITVKFTETTIHTLSVRLLQRYLLESYLFHLERNSAELLKNLSSEVYRVVNGGVLSAINIVSKGLTSLCILIFLVLVDPLIALVVGGVLGASYALIYWLIRLKLAKVGVLVTQLFTNKMRYVNESFGGIKELKVLGREKYYLKQFCDVSEEIVSYAVFNRIVMELPRYVLETVAFGGILSMTIYLVSVRNEAQSVLPMISLYALAGYRLMPALQGVFQSTATLRHDIAAVDLFYNDIKGVSSQLIDLGEQEVKEQLLVKKDLVLGDICFHYPSVSKLAIKNLSLKVKVNTSIGIIGTSGSGKSTLVDVILGLLQPQKGSIAVDGEQLTDDNLRAWQNNIGYVPQVIFLADLTVSENIAFGLPIKEIDQDAVVRAAKMANLHHFIVTELEDGYQTMVGERGVRLSGGQRQRIGIARALYHDPSVIVLDEATSALDTPTESAVMDAVYNLAHKKTIIMIAHRISTVSKCDNLLWLEQGQVKAYGKFEQLMLTEPSFKKFVNAGKSES